MTLRPVARHAALRSGHLAITGQRLDELERPEQAAEEPVARRADARDAGSARGPCGRSV